MMVIICSGAIIYTELVKKAKHCIFYLHKLVFPQMASSVPGGCELVTGYNDP